MKKILGLDLGTTSIGWALVNEKENDNEQSAIIKLGVRVNPLSVDEQSNFEKGKAITTNADRTLKRSARRNLQRFKLRRENLLALLKEHGFITNETVLCEQGNRTTFETRRLRARAVTEEITLEELARVLLMINKKRGYKSSRKADSGEDGKLIDGMTVARQLYNEHLTPGQYVLNLLRNGKKYLPDFYPSDLTAELEAVWHAQQTYYPELLTQELFDAIKNKNEKQTWAICAKPFNINGMKRNGNATEQKIENYRWRAEALEKKIGLEELAIVLQKINGQIRGTSGYLGEISDRSKELYFNHQTVGQYQLQLLEKNPNTSLKNQVFYRQDYLDEFERIWETQASYHPELTTELKHEVRDIVIFYQRQLKSQKGLVGYCELENDTKEVVVDGKKKTVTIGLRVCPKSSPLFQCFKIWQTINNVQVSGNIIPEKQLDLFGTVAAYKYGSRCLTEEEKQTLYKNKVVTRNINTIKCKGEKKKTVQLTPRCQLHNETVYGSMRCCVVKEEKIGSTFTEEIIATVASPRYREALLKRLAEYGGNAKKAFTGRNSMEKNPIYLNDDHTLCVPAKVKTVTYETIFTQRKPIDKDLKVDKVIDEHIQKILQARLNEFGGDAKKAFSNLDENPIWLNRERGIQIKRVTIRGVSNAVALHDKHDVQGKTMCDSEGRRMPSDYVSTNSNHHVAIFRDADGNLQEHVVSYFEATARAIQHLPIVDRDYKKAEGWQFLFTMKRNEYFVFPNEKTGFNPKEIDLLDPKNYAVISANLFRVQKLATKDYFFRHHLETSVKEEKLLFDITWKRITSLNKLQGIVKVRVNNIGQIVAIGEY